MEQTPQEADNLWKVTPFVASERNKIYNVCKNRRRGKATRQLPTSGLKVKVWEACFKISTASL